MTDNILKLPAVKEKTTLGRSSIYALAADGKFPKPIKLGARASGWLESEVNQWIADRIAESRGEVEPGTPSYGEPELSQSKLLGG